MNVSTNTDNQYVPYLDLIFYNNGSGKSYVEYADIHDGIIGTHQPLSIKDFQLLLNAVNVGENNKREIALGFKGLIPNNVLSFRTDAITPQLTWFVKSTYRNIYFKNIKGGFQYPHMVFSVRENELKIFGVKTSRLTPETKLFQLPFPNCYGNGGMCWGTMRKANFMTNDYDQLMKNMETVFYESNFTGDLMNERTSSKIFKFIRKSLNKKIPFDKKQLRTTSLKIKNVLFT